MVSQHFAKSTQLLVSISFLEIQGSDIYQLLKMVSLIGFCDYYIFSYNRCRYLFPRESLESCCVPQTISLLFIRSLSLGFETSLNLQKIESTLCFFFSFLLICMFWVWVGPVPTKKQPKNRREGKRMTLKNSGTLGLKKEKRGKLFANNLNYDRHEIWYFAKKNYLFVLM